ncbi:MAG: hypothetical protein GF331_22400 [Chitinivibrionales bacterium]|nr:hypothetical protein [Chitinivibrionales bacterium]
MAHITDITLLKYLRYGGSNPTANNVRNRYRSARQFQMHETMLYLGFVRLWLNSPAEMVLTDPLGRRVGFDPTAGPTGEHYDEIPDAEYAGYALDDESAAEADSSILLMNPIEGAYDLTVYGTGAGTFTVTSQYGGADGAAVTGPTAGDVTDVGAVHDFPGFFTFVVGPDPDSEAPVTAHDCAFAGGWTNDATVAFNLTATDNKSGVASTHWIVDGGVEQSSHYYPIVVSITGEGSHTVEFWSVDMDGNVETSQTIDIGIDLTPPVTTCDRADGTYDAGTIFTFTLTDALSGPGGTAYAVDGDWASEGGQMVMTETSGTHTLEFWSTDVAGNKETPPNTISITVNPATPPVIIKQPLPQHKAVGEVARFQVYADGPGTLTYQWKKDAVDVAGETGELLTISAVEATDAGAYTCVVTNANGAVESDAADLTIKDGPVIVLAPSSQTITCGEPASVAVVAGGTGPLTYQWYLDGAAIAGATTASYELIHPLPTDAGPYTCEITGVGGTITSPSADLAVDLNNVNVYATDASCRSCFATIAEAMADVADNETIEVTGTNTHVVSTNAYTPAQNVTVDVASDAVIEFADIGAGSIFFSCTPPGSGYPCPDDPGYGQIVLNPGAVVRIAGTTTEPVQIWDTPTPQEPDPGVHDCIGLFSGLCKALDVSDNGRTVKVGVGRYSANTISREGLIGTIGLDGVSGKPSRDLSSVVSLGFQDVPLCAGSHPFFHDKSTVLKNVWFETNNDGDESWVASGSADMEFDGCIFENNVDGGGVVEATALTFTWDTQGSKTIRDCGFYGYQTALSLVDAPEEYDGIPVPLAITGCTFTDNTIDIHLPTAAAQKCGIVNNNGTGSLMYGTVTWTWADLAADPDCNP